MSALQHCTLAHNNIHFPTVILQIFIKIFIFNVDTRKKRKMLGNKFVIRLEENIHSHNQYPKKTQYSSYSNCCKVINYFIKPLHSNSFNKYFVSCWVRKFIAKMKETCFSLALYLFRRKFFCRCTRKEIYGRVWKFDIRKSV